MDRLEDWLAEDCYSAISSVVTSYVVTSYVVTSYVVTSTVVPSTGFFLSLVTSLRTVLESVSTEEGFLVTLLGA